MNEDKRRDRDFLNVGSTKKDDVNTLLSQIIYFKSHNKITPHDFVVLDALVKQLNQRRAAFPRKVLRGMVNKFETIKNTYQR